MSQSSLKAFQEISEKLPGKRKIVFLALYNNPNNTFYKIAFILGCNVNKVSNRFNELENAGLIEKTGIEKRGKYERGKYSVVTDLEKIIENQNQLYVHFVDEKSQLERDHRKCQTKAGKNLLKKRINYYKNKIKNLKMLSI